MKSLARFVSMLAARSFDRSGSLLCVNEATVLDACVSWTWANEFKDDNGDTIVQLAPFGSFPNVQGLQVFGPADAKAVARDFVANAKMLVGLGLPWYVGHPDHPLHKERYKDTRAYGRIKGLEARHDPTCEACKTFIANSGDSVEPCREHGLFAKVRFNEDGKKLISNESFHGHSVNWRLKKVGNEWHPYSLKSVGFTNEPNIPVPAILSANEGIEDELVKRRFCKLTVMRMMANICDEEAAYAEMKNSFGPWESFDACVVKMGDKYDPETAKKVCGRLQADLGEKPAANGRFRRMANYRK